MGFVVIVVRVWQTLPFILTFCRKSKGRSLWYFAHWVLGTTISLVGIFNIYTGLEAFHKRTSRSTRLWTILFTAQIFFMAFFYLFQDKWDYIQKQGILLGNEAIAPSDQTIPPPRENQKELNFEPSAKSNSLGSYFSKSNALKKLFQLTWERLLPKTYRSFFFSKKTYRPLSDTFIFLIVVYCFFCFFYGHNGAPLFYASTLCERMSFFLFIYY